MSKGQALKFDEFGLVIMGAIIFLGIMAVALTTPTEFTVKVTPAEITLNADPGSFQTFNITLSNKVTNVNISTSGEIADWLIPSRTDIGDIREKTVVPITVSVPSTAAGLVKKGRIVVKSSNGEADVAVTIVVSAVKKLTSRTFGVGDFNVSYVAGTKTLDSKDTTFASKSYFYEKPVTLNGQLSDDEIPIVSGGAVKFFVDGANDYGPIVVSQNGQNIFSETVGPGQVIVPINKTDLRAYNTFTIRADNPGLYFWTENVYSLSTVKLDVDYNGPVRKTFNFTLVPEEFSKFDHIQITFDTLGATQNAPPVRILLNGQPIYLAKPSAGLNQNFDVDSLGGFIRVGAQNSLVFGIDQPGQYQLGGATVTIFTRAG